MMNSIPTMKKLLVVTLAIAALALTTLLPTSSQATAVFDETATLYKSKCSSCHGMDGKATTAKGKELKVRAFGSEEVKKMSDQKLLEVVLKGKNKMEGYEKTLGKDKCQALVAYCRSLAK
ncbi:MAG: cytochrome c [Blastocatellia bacterium]